MYVYIYIDQDLVLGITYAYIVQDFVLGVMYIHIESYIYIYRPGLCPWSYICMYIYIVQDSVLGVVYIYIHRVFGVIQICVA